MKDWEARESHHVCMMLGLRETCKVSLAGEIRTFNGPQFFEYIKARGHSTMEFERCDCRKKITE